MCCLPGLRVDTGPAITPVIVIAFTHGISWWWARFCANAVRAAPRAMHSAAIAASSASASAAD
jgi:hypothetical protein